mgnify:FL=1
MRDLAAAADIPEGGVKVVAAGALSGALCKVAGAIYAVENRCSHDDGPLGEGDLEGFAIMCPRHGAKFDVRNGEVLRMPAAFPCRTFPVKIENGRVLAEVPPS